MTEPQAFEAIERMRQMFPTWSAWVLNKGNPDQVFRDFSQSIKPLPYDDVIAALDRMKEAQEVGVTFERYVNLLKLEADNLRFNRQSDKIAAEAQAMDADRQRNRDRAVEGTSWWALIRNEEIYRKGPELFPDDPERMANWQESAQDAVWLECKLYQEGAANGG